jgi:hypothetical protein
MTEAASRAQLPGHPARALSTTASSTPSELLAADLRLDKISLRRLSFDFYVDVAECASSDQAR